MTTHNPLLPRSRKCSSVPSAGRKPQKRNDRELPSSVLLLLLESVGGQGGRRGGGRGAARRKILGTSGQDLDQLGAEVEWPEGKSLGLDQGLSLAEGEQGGAGWSRGTGILFG